MTTFSYWEQQGLQGFDWVVVGAGLVGLQSARCLKSAFPDARVVVLDDHAMGNAASLRNAGFACFGSAGELLDEINRTSESEALSLYEKRFLGIQRLMQRYGPDRLGFESTGGMEVFSKAESENAHRIIEALPYLNQLLLSVQPSGAFHVCDTLPTGMASMKKASWRPPKAGFKHIGCIGLCGRMPLPRALRFTRGCG